MSFFKDPTLYVLKEYNFIPGVESKPQGYKSFKNKYNGFNSAIYNKTRNIILQENIILVGI